MDAHIALPLLYGLIAVALLFDFLNGLHDAANSIATIVSTRVLRPQYAVVWAAFFNFVAAFGFGTAVAKTVGAGMVDLTVVSFAVIFSGLIGAIVWDLLTWYFGLPTSSSHALFGGYAGAAVAKAGDPAAMARAAAELGVPFVHVSTDYVFDGSGDRPWRESDPTGPLGVYGATKLAGEQGIAAAGGQWAVMRTSWVFSAHGANFVKTMLRLGAEREVLRVVADQHGGPTPAADIARDCLTMLGAMQADRARGGVAFRAPSL